MHRLILPIILHSGFFHIFWNLLSLLSIGFTVEKALGKWYKYLSLIIFGGIGGNLFSAVIDPMPISVGASSSLFAIIGCLIIWYAKHWSSLGPLRNQYLIFLGCIFVCAMINGFTMAGSGIDNWAHLGGLIFGLLISLILLQPWAP